MKLNVSAEFSEPMVYFLSDFLFGGSAIKIQSLQYCSSFFKSSRKIECYFLYKSYDIYSYFDILQQLLK